MRRIGLTLATLAVAAALPMALATSAVAQVKGGPGGDAAVGGGGARGGGPAIGGGGMRGGGAMMGGGGMRAGGPAMRGGGGAAWAGGPRKGGPIVGGPGRGPGWAGNPGPRGNPGWRGRGGPRWVGPGVGFGTGLLLGGALAAPYYYDDYYYDYPYASGGYVSGGPSPEDVAYCTRRYRSYDPRTGTYLNNDGNRYPCP